MRALVPMFLVALAAACAEDPKRPPAESDIPVQPGIGGIAAGAGDGGAVRDAGDGGTDAGASCTELGTTGSLIDQLGVVGDPPAGTGGTIGDGVYDISEARIYQGAGGAGVPTGNAYQGSIRVTGTTFERFVIFKSSAGSAESRSSGTLTPSGVNLTIGLTCPSALQEQLTYTATDTTLVLTNLVTKESFTYTKKL